MCSKWSISPKSSQKKFKNSALHRDGEGALVSKRFWLRTSYCHLRWALTSWPSSDPKVHKSTRLNLGKMPLIKMTPDYIILSHSFSRTKVLLMSFINQISIIVLIKPNNHCMPISLQMRHCMLHFAWGQTISKGLAQFLACSRCWKILG